MKRTIYIWKKLIFDFVVLNILVVKFVISEICYHFLTIIKGSNFLRNS